MVDFISDDPNNPAYYYPNLLFLAFILVTVYIIIQYIRVVDPIEQIVQKSRSRVGSMDSAGTYICPEKKSSLKLRYLIGYVLTRGSIWSKSPYLYTLYNLYHGFTMAEIGVLYIIDAICALVGGPITGNLADIFGRRTFCQIYNIFVVSNLGLRLTGSKTLAYFAQMLTGIGSNLITTSFESWLICESGKVFRDNEFEKDIFLKSIFKEQTFIDAIMSLVVTSVCAILYTFYGIFAPIILSMTFSFLGFIAMTVLWDENRPAAAKPDENNKVQTKYEGFCEALSELKKREIISVALIESLFQGAFNVYLFAWTPILQHSAIGQINVGFIFINFVFFIIIGTKVFELVVIHLNADVFTSITCGLFAESCCFIVIYLFPDYRLRVILLSSIQGLTGFFNPSFSTIKSRIIEEKHRAFLMSIFRIPLNCFVIFVLLCLKYVEPLQITLIISGMITTAFFIALSLIIWRPALRPKLLKKKEKDEDLRSQIIAEVTELNVYEENNEIKLDNKDTTDRTNDGKEEEVEADDDQIRLK